MKTLLLTLSLAIPGVLMTANVEAARKKSKDFPPGMGVDADAEKKLAARLEKISKMSRAAKPEWKALNAELSAARSELLPLLAKVCGREDADKWQELKTPKHLLDAGDALGLPKKAPMVLYGKAAPGNVRACWQEQLVYFSTAADGLMKGKGLYVRELLGWPFSRQPWRRALAMSECLRECQKLVLLLSHPAQEVKVRKGKLLFEDDFSKGAGNWLQYGQCVTKNDGDAFRLRDEKVAHPDAHMWTKREFRGNYLAEFTFTPHTKGTKAGALFSICGRPRKSKKLSVCVGRTMGTYNFGIDAYHFSMHRGTSGLGNARRVGPGLKMLASGKDPCPTPGKPYRVAIGKVDATVFLIVDGQLIHSYYDAGTYGRVLDVGRIGLRHWAGLDASYKQFKVHRLLKKGEKEVSELIEPKGKMLFEEKFVDLANWRHEGAGRMVLDKEEKGSMRVEIVGSQQGKAGSQAFCTKDLPDNIAVEYDIKVLTTKGLVLSFVAMRGAKGEDMFDSGMPKREGIFDDYVRNPLLRSYHVSMSRYGDNGVHTGVSNFRRNPGLVMMGQGPDLCEKTGKWYGVRLVKDGPRLQLGIDGRLAHEFTDPLELDTAVPDGGKVGFRAIGAEVRALVRKFRVRALR